FVHDAEAALAQHGEDLVAVLEHGPRGDCGEGHGGIRVASGRDAGAGERGAVHLLGALDVVPSASTVRSRLFRSFTFFSRIGSRNAMIPPFVCHSLCGSDRTRQRTAACKSGASSRKSARLSGSELSGEEPRLSASTSRSSRLPRASPCTR